MTRRRTTIERLLFLAFAFLLCASAAAGKGLQSSTAYSVGSQLTAIAAADFNVDGHLDLLVVDSPGMTFSTVHVLLGNGDGTFQAALDSPATPNLSAVAVGRFDGDNFPDIAVTDSVRNQIRVLLGDGSGNFVANASLPTGAAPAAIATGDINDDGKLDLVVANSDDMTLSIFIGVGNGTFITKPRVSTESVGLPGLVGVVIGDFDSDHKPDVVAAWNASAISILKGNGDGTFGTASVMSAASTNFTAIAATDFNLDGALDLIIPNTNNVLFLAGRNNLMFQTPVAFGAQTWPKAVAVGDANADGRPDLMVANWFSNSASVLLNNGLGGIAVARGYSAVTLPVGIAVGDFNEDGKLDLATCGTPVSPFVGVNNLGMSLGNGDGTMRAAFSYDYQTGGTVGSSEDVVVADFTNDGWPEIAAGDASGSGTNPNDRISLFDLSGLFVPSTIQSARQVSPGLPWKMAVGQMTASGNLDIIVAGSNAIQVLPGLGNGTFGSPVSTPIPSPDPRLAVGDFDHDGKLDVVDTRVVSDSEARVLFGNGDGSFRVVTTSLSVGGLINAVAAADFNNDDKPDVAIGSVAGGGAAGGDLDIFLTNGDTTFTRLGPFKVGVYPGAIAVADLNNNGNLDLAVANTGNGNPGSLSVLMGNGDGSFQAAVTTALPSRVADATTGDFDGDGFQDVVVSEESGTVDLFTNQGDGSFGPPTRYFAGEDARSLVAADVNHDGALDLVAATGKVMNIFPNDGGTLVLETPDFLIFSSSEAVTIRAGQSADIMLSVFLWPSMPATGPMTFACAGLPALSSCSANPSSIPLTGTILSTVITVDTTQASLGGPARLDIRFPPVYTGLWLFALGCLCVSLGLLRAPGRRLVWGRLTLLCLLLCGTLVVSCGGGSNAGSTGSAGSTGGGGSGVGSSSPGTPLGSYPLSVLATVPTASGPVTHEVAVNLTVAQ